MFQQCMVQIISSWIQIIVTYTCSRFFTCTLHTLYKQHDMYQNLLIGVHKINMRYVGISWKIKLFFYQFTLVGLCFSTRYTFLSSKSITIIDFYYKLIAYILCHLSNLFSMLISFPSNSQSSNVQNDKEKQVLNITSTKWMQWQGGLILSILKLHQFHCCYQLVSFDVC